MADGDETMPDVAETSAASAGGSGEPWRAIAVPPSAASARGETEGYVAGIDKQGGPNCQAQTERRRQTTHNEGPTQSLLDGGLDQGRDGSVT